MIRDDVNLVLFVLDYLNALSQNLLAVVTECSQWRWFMVWNCETLYGHISSYYLECRCTYMYYQNIIL